MAKIIIAGDLVVKGRLTNLFNEGKYSQVFNTVRRVVETVNYSIVNMEAPIVENYMSPILKSGPCLGTNETVINAIKYIGFDCVTLANNHFRDYGDEGVKNTLLKCKENNIETLGGGINHSNSQEVLYKNIYGKRICFLNFCENEFSIATDHRGGSAPLNLIQNYYKISEAKKNADYVVVIMHGGHEYYQLPSPRMVDTYRYFVDVGADVVLNHHQHCYSGYEIHNGKPIFYGLGNFCFDWDGKRNCHWNEGFMVILNFEKDINFECIPYIQCDEEPSIKLLDNKQINYFKQSITKLNNIISDKVALNKEYEDFISKMSSNYILNLTPYVNRYLLALCRRKLLPSFLTKKKIIKILNLFTCESHRDIIIRVLNERKQEYEK